ncbi:1-acyl-sn-glycerol-3-phosphate acyltransferase [Salipiger bermudensis]|uniref:lysophospholipid acyltransferase family protein n=1 Tax=Salipiger bermudensis TaxID=344736 RepID=UPI001C9942A9|nr:lysophospholipid acyltransferase family protein [Salipiger bermudensis]MBY6005623.1 1-acyl-sn-glycerol-3-phosphate acyltransferase [Salipiger bermudensis]
MSGPTWRGDAPEPVRLSAADWGRVALRGPALALVILLGVLLTLPLRLIERPLCGQRRPLTPLLTQAVSRLALVILGIGLVTRGPRLSGPGALVANHASWLDIFALNARRTVYFVSKAEVSGWPGIGTLARLTGTVFITRDPRAAAEQKRVFEERLLHGHRLLFFPEGTSTDGQRILPFKPTLFAAFFSDHLRHEMALQAVTVIWHAPAGEDPRFYGWWGDMGFGPHLLKVLASRRRGRVELIYHPPVRVDDHPNRKTLAAHLEDEVRSVHPAGH